MSKQLKVHSIFESISGEMGTIPQGIWCTFIRLQGCNLRCSYCDTKETQPVCFDDTAMYMDIMEIVKSVKTPYVTITGGEPLIHDALPDLIAALAFDPKMQRAPHYIQVETNGSLPIPERVSYMAGWVVDYKTPSSGMTAKMLPTEQFTDMLPLINVVIKFVVHTEKDMECTINMIQEMAPSYKLFFAVSPTDADAKKVKWIMAKLKTSLPSYLMHRTILSLQLHKICGLA